MKLLKVFILEIILLIAMVFCGVVTMIILDIIFQLNGNIFQQGVQAGFIAWLIFSSLIFYTKVIKIKKQKYNKTKQRQTQ